MTDERIIHQLVEISAAFRVLGAALLKLVEATEDQNRTLQELLAYLEQKETPSTGYFGTGS